MPTFGGEPDLGLLNPMLMYRDRIYQTLSPGCLEQGICANLVMDPPRFNAENVFSSVPSAPIWNMEPRQNSV